MFNIQYIRIWWQFLILFVIINTILSKLIRPMLIPSSISLIHSVIVFVYSKRNECFSEHMIFFSLSYFTYDLIAMGMGPITKEVIIYMLHHVFTICGCIYIVNPEIKKILPILTFLIGQIELSSSVFHFSTILKMIFVKTNLLILILEIINIIVWIYCRIYLIFSFRKKLTIKYLSYLTLAIYLISVVGLVSFILNI